MQLPMTHYAAKLDRIHNPCAKAGLHPQPLCQSWIASTTLVPKLDCIHNPCAKALDRLHNPCARTALMNTTWGNLTQQLFNMVRIVWLMAQYLIHTASTTPLSGPEQTVAVQQLHKWVGTRNMVKQLINLRIQSREPMT